MSNNTSFASTNTPTEHVLWIYSREKKCFVHTEQAEASLLNASLYGYGCYTSWLGLENKTQIKLHLARLQKDAKALNLSYTLCNHTLLSAITRLNNTLNKTDKVSFRLTLLPVVKQYSQLLTSDVINTELILSSRPKLTDNKIEIKLKTVQYQRPFATIKINGIADPLLHRRKAQEEGFDDVLFVNSDQSVSEASTSNIFIFKSSHIISTPVPERDYCLPGITRKRVLDTLDKATLAKIDFTPITIQDLLHCNGAFLCNAIQGLQKIKTVNHLTINWAAWANELFETLEQANDTIISF